MNIAFDVLFQWGPYGPHTPMGPHGAGTGMGVWGGGMGTGWGLLWWLVMLALVVGIVVAAVVLLRQADGGDGRDDGDGAMAVLRERYARGEMDDEEFERRRGRLTQQTP